MKFGRVDGSDLSEESGITVGLSLRIDALRELNVAVLLVSVPMQHSIRLRTRT